MTEDEADQLAELWSHVTWLADQLVTLQADVFQLTLAVERALGIEILERPPRPCSSQRLRLVKKPTES